jgi:hypothetical protein
VRLQPGPGGDPLPVDPSDGDVLAHAAGADGMPLDRQGLDPLEREEAERALGPAVDGGVVLDVPDQAELADLRRGHRQLGHASAGDVHVDDGAGGAWRAGPQGRLPSLSLPPGPPSPTTCPPDNYNKVSPMCSD